MTRSTFNTKQKQSLRKCFEKGWSTTRTLNHVNSLQCSQDNQLTIYQVSAAVRYYPAW